MANKSMLKKNFSFLLTQKQIFTEKETHFQFQVFKWGMVVDP